MLPNVKPVQSFLGLTACFRKIIPSYAKIAKPLSILLWENNLFTFGHEQQEVFEKLVRWKSSFGNSKARKKKDRASYSTYACKHGYGAVLLQEAEEEKLHPAYYMSNKKSLEGEKYSSYPKNTSSAAACC